MFVITDEQIGSLILLIVGIILGFISGIKVTQLNEKPKQEITQFVPVPVRCFADTILTFKVDSNGYWK